MPVVARWDLIKKKSCNKTEVKKSEWVEKDDYSIERVLFKKHGKKVVGE